MPVTTFVAPELFDSLVEYAGKVESDKEISSAPTNFCDNFYAQFFQNRMKREITGFGNAAKESAVKLRITVEGKEGKEIVLLIALFERYCDLRDDVFSEEYGGGDGDSLPELQDYLQNLLGAITAWSRLEQLGDIECNSAKASSALQKALQLVKK
jgi:hypothetical protein